MSIRQHFRKCCRIDEKWCRAEKCCRICEKCCRVDENSGNVVKSTRNVVESTTFSTFTGKMTKVLNSCRVDFRPNRREMLYSRRHFQCSTGKGKSCQIHEKCCRVDEIFGNVVEPARNVVESATYSNFHSDPTTIPEMLSNRREMLSSGRHGDWC